MSRICSLVFFTALLAGPGTAQLFESFAGTSGAFASNTSSAFAQCAGKVRVGNVPFQQDLSGGASSSRHALTAFSRSFTATNTGTPLQVYGQARSTFYDVVFSDGAPGRRNVTAQLCMELEASSDGFRPSVGVSWTIPGVGSQNLFFNAPNATTGIKTSSFTVSTNVPYQIQLTLSANSSYFRPGTKASCRAMLAIASTPFVLPSGVTCNSKHWAIQNNKHIASGPDLTPSIEAGFPVVAGSSTTISYTGGESNALGFLVLGSAPNGTGVSLSPWSSIDLPVVVNVVPFRTDANGAYSLSVPIAAGLSGVTAGIQAAQEHAATRVLYSSNAWRVAIQ